VVFCWSGCLRGHLMLGKGISITQQTVHNTVALVCLAFFTVHCLLWLHKEKHSKELLMILWRLLAASRRLSEPHGFF
jgi:thiosulfate reductase cytochrome b subunit